MFSYMRPWAGLFIIGFVGYVNYFFSANLEASAMPNFKAPFLILVLLLVALFVAAKLGYKFYKYELTDMGFRKESGIIWKQYVTIPYDRIQNVDIYRGVLARILGLSDLQIHTAGVGGVAMGEGRLPGLSVADAERMRDELIMRAKQSRNGQGL